jgi:serine/threonine protein kinase
MFRKNTNVVQPANVPQSDPQKDPHEVALPFLKEHFERDSSFAKQGGFSEISKWNVKEDRACPWSTNAIILKVMRNRSPLEEINCLNNEKNVLSIFKERQVPHLVDYFGFILSAQKVPMLILGYVHYCLDELIDCNIEPDLVKQKENVGVYEVTQEIKHSYSIKLALMGELALAIAYLHKNDFVHRDIKSGNVLINYLGNHQYQAKLTDFGYTCHSKNFDKKNPINVTKTQGTLCWLAPEIVVGKRQDEYADVWSMMITFIELLRLQFPYEGTPETGIYKNLDRPGMAKCIKQGKVARAPGGYGLQKMIDAGLHMNPQCRPSALGIYALLQQEERKFVTNEEMDELAEKMDQLKLTS